MALKVPDMGLGQSKCAGLERSFAQGSHELQASLCAGRSSGQLGRWHRLLRFRGQASVLDLCMAPCLRAFSDGVATVASVEVSGIAVGPTWVPGDREIGTEASKLRGGGKRSKVGRDLSKRKVKEVYLEERRWVPAI